jgi:predicted SnoaL-like aldol condensation-catalyzing enzyme
MSEPNKRVLRRFFQEVLNEGQVAPVGELFARDWVGHGPQREFDAPAALMPFLAALRTAWPDLQITVEAQIAEGDLVATRWTAHGLRRAERGRVDGRPATAAGLTLARLASGKIVEAWTNWEMGYPQDLVST